MGLTRQGGAWRKGIVTWREQGALCISVPFTWLLSEARGICYRHPNERIVAGGPAVRLMPDYLADVAEIETLVPSDPLRRANPDASRTTFGCPNSCAFCGVRRIEHEFREIADFTPAPVMCDSNLLACSDRHLRRVVNRLKTADFDQVDFNQGLDARLLTKERARLLAELPLRPRFAWDAADDEGPVMAAIGSLEAAGVPCRSSNLTNTASAPAHIYCLVGWRETPEEALYRMETLRAQRLCGVAMRYQPLDALTKNAFCPPQWNPRDLLRFTKFWNRQRWLGGLSYEEFCAGEPPAHQPTLLT